MVKLPSSHPSETLQFVFVTTLSPKMFWYLQYKPNSVETFKCVKQICGGLSLPDRFDLCCEYSSQARDYLVLRSI